jgi:hypothetical protein
VEIVKATKTAGMRLVLLSDINPPMEKVGRTQQGVARVEAGERFAFYGSSPPRPFTWQADTAG